jgi:hypothetical protein
MKLRKKMKRNMKVFSIIATVVIMLLSIFMMIRNLTVKEYKEKKIVKYEYTLNKSIKYKGNLLNNSIYGNVLGEDQFYPQKILKSVDITYNLDYQGSEETPINTEYQLVAKIYGYFLKQDNKLIYWTKEIPISDKVSDTITGNQTKINKTINVTLNQYIDFIDRAAAETELELNNEITISMVGTLNTQTSYGNVNIPFEMTLASPVDKVFKFEKSGLDIKQGSLTDVQKVELPINIGLVILFSVISLISLLSLLYVLIFTIDYEWNDIVSSQVKNILKNYGNKMVELGNEIRNTAKHNYEVNNMKDLLKVADELHKPIIYEYDNQYTIKDFKLYVQNGDEIYIYSIIDNMNSIDYMLESAVS